MDKEREKEIRKRYPATKPPDGNVDRTFAWQTSQIQLYDAALDHIHDAVVVTDDRGKTTYLNRAAERLLGRSIAELRSMNILDCFRDENGDSSSWMGRKILRLEEMKDERQIVVRPDECETPVLLTLRPIVKQGVLIRVVGTMRDISELERRNRELEEANSKLEAAKRRLEEIARTDEMTGLLNRRALLERLSDHIALARKHDEPLSIIYIDPNNFKPVNDTYGHKEGDRVIRQVAKRLRRTLQDTDVVARYGGDEFLAILPRTDGVGLQKALEKLWKELWFSIDLQRPHSEKCDGRHITCAIGGATRVGSTIPSAETFIELSELAMYRSKREKSHYETDIED